MDCHEVELSAAGFDWSLIAFMNWSWQMRWERIPNRRLVEENCPHTIVLYSPWQYECGMFVCHDDIHDQMQTRCPSSFSLHTLCLGGKSRWLCLDSHNMNDNNHLYWISAIVGEKVIGNLECCWSAMLVKTTMGFENRTKISFNRFTLPDGKHETIFSGKVFFVDTCSSNCFCYDDTDGEKVMLLDFHLFTEKWFQRCLGWRCKLGHFVVKIQLHWLDSRQNVMVRLWWQGFYGWLWNGRWCQFNTQNQLEVLST